MADSILTGTIDAIGVDDKGVLLSFAPKGRSSTARAPNFSEFSYRLDASSTYLPLMFELAKFAMEKGLVVTACGQGDEREKDFSIHELRVFDNSTK